MPTRPSGRVGYEGMNSALAGGLTPVPMGAYEAEMAPLLNRILSQFRKASEIGIPDIGANFEGDVLTLPDQMRKQYQLLNAYHQQLKGMSLEDILSEKFQFKAPYFHQDRVVGDELVSKVGLDKMSKPELVKHDLDWVYDRAQRLLNRMYHHLGKE